MMQILCAVRDGEITTREQARALVDEECAEYAKVMEISEQEARESLLANITLAATMYYPLDEQARLADLFELTLKENDGNEGSNNPVSEV
jgi:hypothetical protein